MKYFTLVRANIKSQKGSFIGILTLAFIIAISLLSVLSIWMNANAYENEQIDRIGYGDITYWINETEDRDGLLDEIADLDEVESVKAQDILIFGEYEIYSGGSEITPVSGSLHVQTWTKEGGYHIYNENLTGICENPEEPSEGEIYVSPAFSSLYDTKIGDMVGVRITEDGEMLRYTIKGYFEDPVAGSALMGMKQALIAKDDMNRLENMIHKAGESTSAKIASAVHIVKNPDSNLTLNDLQKVLGEKTSLLQIPGFSYSKSTITGFMLILQNIFSGFLIVFVLVLMVVAVIVVGHSISSSIEQNYVDMGILKALGYTRTDLRVVQLLQYLMVFLSGMVPGIPVSMLVVKGIDRLTVPVVGLMIPADIPLGASLVSLSIIMLAIMGFVFVKTARIGRITPIRAIRGGAEDVYFKSRLTAPVRKRGLSFWLACRQLVSGKKQYLSACLVTALLVFFLSLTVRLDAWLGPDGKGLMNSFSASAYDISVRYEEDFEGTVRYEEKDFEGSVQYEEEDSEGSVRYGEEDSEGSVQYEKDGSDMQDIRREVEETLEARAHIMDSYQFKMERGFLNQTEYLMNVISEPEYYNILEGRTCLYQNELVMTDLVANELNVGIGDSVSLSVDGREQEFIVSGIYQCANDIGANFGVTKEGFESFQDEEGRGKEYYILYRLQDSSAVEEIIETLQQTYGERITVEGNTWSGTDAIVLTASALMAVMLVITVVFILVTVSMTGSKILYKEQHDLGIYKSLGFLSGKLRLAFALRFGIVAFLGSAAGIILSIYLTDPLADRILRVCGISHFTSHPSLLYMLVPGFVVCALFLVFAYLAAGKVKKVEPGILIVE